MQIYWDYRFLPAVRLTRKWCTVLLEKLTGSHLVKKFPSFYGNRRLFTAFTEVRHLSLSWARSIQPIPPSCFLKIHLNIILTSTPGFSKWAVSPRFPHQNPVWISLLPHTCYMLRPRLLVKITTNCMRTFFKILEKKLRRDIYKIPKIQMNQFI